MGLNTCRKQWKEQRKQNKIENLKTHSTSLARMFFTLQMQVTTANKPGWMLGGYEAVCTITWAETRLPRGSRHSRADSHFRRASPVVSQSDSAALSITVLWAIPFTHLQRGLFQPTSHWAPWFSNGNGTFWERCHSNLLFGHITPRTMKRSHVLFPIWKERL